VKLREAKSRLPEQDAGKTNFPRADAGSL